MKRFICLESGLFLVVSAAIILLVGPNTLANDPPCSQMLRQYGYAPAHKAGRVVASAPPSSEEIKKAMTTVASYIDSPKTPAKDLRFLSRYLLKSVRGVERSKRVNHGEVMVYLSAAVQAMKSKDNPYKKTGGLTKFMSECRFYGVAAN